MSIEWNGCTKSRTFNNDYVDARTALADAARNYQWEKVFEILDNEVVGVNSWRLDGRSFFTPLHQAAYGNAAVDLVEKLIALGAWRTLQNSKGERPVDIAEQKGHKNLVRLLQPVYKRKVPFGILMKIQHYFHLLIRQRAEELVEKENLRLPELVVLLDLEEPKLWFPVPGMYGGFSFWLANDGPSAKLMSESWCRVVDGSGQRHIISSSGFDLVDVGFV